MLKQYGCKRCGHTWIPRKEKPITCPKCRSPYWDKERKNGGDGNEGKIDFIKQGISER